jgi:hypothetical protein
VQHDCSHDNTHFKLIRKPVIWPLMAVSIQVDTDRLPSGSHTVNKGFPTWTVRYGYPYTRMCTVTVRSPRGDPFLNCTNNFKVGAVFPCLLDKLKPESCRFLYQLFLQAIRDFSRAGHQQGDLMAVHLPYVCMKINLGEETEMTKRCRFGV